MFLGADLIITAHVLTHVLPMYGIRCTHCQKLARGGVGEGKEVLACIAGRLLARPCRAPYNARTAQNVYKALSKIKGLWLKSSQALAAIVPAVGQRGSARLWPGYPPSPTE